MLDAAQAAATLRLLVPGFIALRLFDIYGSHVRRGALELTLWSLVLAAFIATGVDALKPPDDGIRLILGVVAAVLVAATGVVVWYVVATVWPRAAIAASLRAWDAVLRRPQWVQVWLNDGPVISGHIAIVASSAEAEDVDLYVQEPAWVDGEKTIPVTGTDGFLIPAASIKMIQVLEPVRTR